MNTYKVFFKDYGNLFFRSYEVVKATNELDAMKKVQDQYETSLEKLNAKEVKEPTLTDYYAQRAVSWFLFFCLVGAVGMILVMGW